MNLKARGSQALGKASRRVSPGPSVSLEVSRSRSQPLSDPGGRFVGLGMDLES